VGVEKNSFGRGGAWGKKGTPDWKRPSVQTQRSGRGAAKKSAVSACRPYTVMPEGKKKKKKARWEDVGEEAGANQGIMKDSGDPRGRFFERRAKKEGEKGEQ